MTAPTPLENRLRRGLQAAAEVLPDAPLEPPTPGDGRARSSSRSRLSRLARGGSGGRRWVPLAAAVAAVTVVAAALVVSDRPGGGDREPSDVRVASPGEEAQERPEVRQANGRVPGQAVVVNPEQGASELRTYGPDGAQTGTVDLAPLEGVQSAGSDLEGGWVACGMAYQEYPALTPEQQAAVDEALESVPTVTGTPPRAAQTTVAEPTSSPGGASVPTTSAASGNSAPPTTSTLPPGDAGDAGDTGQVTGGLADELMWFPAGGEPVVLEPRIPPVCSAGSIQVVDSADGPMLLYAPMLGGSAPAIHGLVLATGEEREVPVDPGATHLAGWSASTGRVVATTDEGDLELFDLASGDRLPVVPISVPGTGDVVLAPDATSVAVIVNPSGELEPVDVVVYDLTTGAERFRETVPMNLEGAQLSYDGTTVAVGSFYDSGGGTVTVVDLASGARHTLDAHGILL